MYVRMLYIYRERDLNEYMSTVLMFQVLPTSNELRTKRTTHKLELLLVRLLKRN